jgi:hypothetical protein
MGVESDTRAWSAFGGRWRPVQVGYPRFWPPGWGADPPVVLALGLAVTIGAALALYFVGAQLFDAGWFGAGPLAVLCGAVVLGAAVAVVAAGDWGTAVEVTGPVLRVRIFGDDRKRRHYVAVDDGTSESILAFRVSPSQYARVEQEEFVTVRATKSLGRVRWIIAAPPGLVAPGE